MTPLYMWGVGYAGPGPPRESTNFEVPILFVIGLKIVVFGGGRLELDLFDSVEPLPGVRFYRGFGFSFI